MKIRKIQQKDLPKIIKINKSVEEFNVSKVASAWTSGQLSRWVKSRNDVCLVIKDGPEVVGFALSACHVPTGKVTLENLWVNPKYRDKGLARSLVVELLKQWKNKKYVYVMSFTTLEEKNLGFLTKNGFNIGKKGFWIDRYI